MIRFALSAMFLAIPTMSFAQWLVPDFSTTSASESLSHIEALAQMKRNIESIAQKSGNNIGQAERLKKITDLPSIYVGIQVEWPMKVAFVSELGVQLHYPKTTQKRGQGEFQAIGVLPPIHPREGAKPIPHKDEWTKKLKKDDIVTVNAIIRECTLQKISIDEIRLSKYSPPAKKR